MQCLSYFPYLDIVSATFMENDQLRSDTAGASNSSHSNSWNSNKPESIALVDILDTAFNSTVDQPQNVDFTLGKNLCLFCSILHN